MLTVHGRASQHSPGEHRGLVPGKIANMSLEWPTALQLTLLRGLLLTAFWIRVCLVSFCGPTALSSSLRMARFSPSLLCSRLHSAAFSLNPLQTPRSEKIPEQDSSDLSPHRGDKTRVETRPRNRGQKQIAPRKDFIQRHCVFYLAFTVVVFHKRNYFPRFEKLLHNTTPSFQNFLRKRKASLTLNFIKKILLYGL